MLKINAKEEPIALNKQIINSEFLSDHTTTYEVKVYLVLDGGASCKNLTDDKECDKYPVEFTYTCTTTKLCTATDMRKQTTIDNHKLDVNIKNITNETNQHVEIEAN